MSKASQLVENKGFADRLRLALNGVGIRPSATVLANEFNLRYWGESITITTARNWLLGKSIPMQDKLRVLADWLHVSADELRYGTLTAIPKPKDSGLDSSVLTMQADLAGRRLRMRCSETLSAFAVTAIYSLCLRLLSTDSVCLAARWPLWKRFPHPCRPFDTKAKCGFVSVRGAPWPRNMKNPS